MNERDRYRGIGSQRASNDRGNNDPEQSNRDYSYGARSGEEWGARREEGGSSDYGQRSEYGQASGRNQSDRQRDQRGFGRDVRQSQESGYGQDDRALRDQDREYRGGSSGLGRERDYQQESGSFASGSGALGSGRGGASRGGSGSGTYSNFEENPWQSRSDFYTENRGDTGAKTGFGQGTNRLGNFGDRTRSEAKYYGSGSNAQSHTGRGPKGYARSDERIREDVCERLSENDEVDASDVEITVSNREVTLVGSVETRRMKHIAEDIADSVSGVEDVHNQISVRKAFLREMVDKISGDDDKATQHHANTGTKNSTGTPSTTQSTPSLSSSGSSSPSGVNGRA